MKPIRNNVDSMVFFVKLLIFSSALSSRYVRFSSLVLYDFMIKVNSQPELSMNIFITFSLVHTVPKMKIFKDFLWLLLLFLFMFTDRNEEDKRSN